MNCEYNILILSGPSGSGKSTLCAYLLENIKDAYYCISTTTRKIRANEVDGVDYYFTNEASFKQGIENNEFIEWARVHNNFYGSSLKQVQDAIKDKKFIIFDVDVQGHFSIKKHFKRAKSVFITTKDMQTLESRLKNRNTDSSEVLENRILNAKSEIKRALEFDYLLVNDNISKSRQTLLAIANAICYSNNDLRVDRLHKLWQI